jgi:hypothetical protein
MARIDVPMLKCDRCNHTTQDENEMQKFHQIVWYYGDSGDQRTREDLCEGCWFDYNAFMANTISVHRREP